MVTRKNDEAVSPVIGVILMVAITVILAAVIAAFVFGMAGNVAKTKNVAATAQVVGANIVITYQGGPDSGLLATTGNPIVGAVYNNAGTAQTVPAFPAAATLKVGDSVTVAKTDNLKWHVVVTAAFNDGSTQVILDTNV